MKKIIIIIVCLIFPLLVYAYNWDGNVIAMYDFEQNGSDDLDDYDLVAIGTPTYNSSDVKSGSYKLAIGSFNNTFKFSDDLISALADLSSYTVECWYYYDGGDTYTWQPVFMGGDTYNWHDYDNSFGIMFRKNWTKTYFAFDNSTEISEVPSTGWHHISIQWGSNTAKYYIDQTLKSTKSSQTNNPFDSITILTFLQAYYGDSYNPSAYIDKMVISKITRDGAETTPVPTATPTSATTPTFTDSPTFTETPTFTPTFTATPTPTITETCGLCVVYSDWEVLTKNAYNYNIPTGRVGHQMLNYDGKMWIIGGIKDSSLTQNDVWYSINGVDWTLATGNAAFGTRSYFCSTVFDNKMWVMGGFSPTENYRDVWYSINGVDWTLATGNAAFGARNYSKVLSYNNKMYILLGTYDNQTFYTDVWESLDGVIWTETTANCGIGERDAHQAIVFDGKMWIIGGETYNGYIFYKDAWYSSNGADWTAATQNTAFGHRSYGNLLSLNGYMWLFGGNNRLNYVLENDVWYSVNGVDWYARTLNSACGYRDSAAAVVFNNQLYLSGGILPNGGTPGISDVWTNKIEQYCLSETPTSTVTPTVTPTATPTKTPRLTDTPTPTFTITETNTASPTLTETRDVTARATKTMTLTVIGTVTATRTVIVYALYSPTKTPTICCTKEYIIITPTPTHVSPWIQWGWPW